MFILPQVFFRFKDFQARNPNLFRMDILAKSNFFMDFGGIFGANAGLELK